MAIKSTANANTALLGASNASLGGAANGSLGKGGAEDTPYKRTTTLKPTPFDVDVYDPQKRKKSISLEQHGDEAITLIQAHTPFGIALDISRLIMSCILLILSIACIVWAITEDHTLYKKQFEPYLLFIFLFCGMFCVGVLEGLQIAVVELAHEDPEDFATFHPRTAKMLAWENKGRNVERFLIGRQVLLIFLVFVLGRVATFDTFIDGTPDWITAGFMHSGFLGVVLIVTVAQLTPQVLAAAYPVEFLNIPGMNVAFGICLFVEITGVAHVVWLLCVLCKNTFYSCVCKYHHQNPLKNKHKSEATVATAMVKVADAVIARVEDDDGSNNSSRVKQLAHLNNPFKELGSKLGNEVDSLLQTMDSRPDLFWQRGDHTFAAPEYFSEKFTQSGLTPPSFLLPADDPNHIPPHIVAMSLLRIVARKT